MGDLRSPDQPLQVLGGGGGLHFVIVGGLALRDAAGLRLHRFHLHQARQVSGLQGESKELGTCLRSGGLSDGLYKEALNPLPGRGANLGYFVFRLFFLPAMP